MARKEIDVSDLVIAIERRIDALGISKSEAARRLGISHQRLDQWLRGSDPRLDADLQASVARFLDISPRQVLELMGYDLGSARLGGYLRCAAA